MSTITHRVCNVCKVYKSLNDYYADKQKRLNKAYTCKECSRARQHKWQKENRSRLNESNVKHRWKEYGIELDANLIKEQLLKQNNACSICKTEISLDYYHYDHNHKTNKLREILCPPCNKGIGFFDDSPYLLRLAISYLNKYKEPDD